ncbi:MAG TPA: hypothetical protein VHU43_01975, partial [Steroidobacteraceae bacterium]|nr:hypothetical protein [Steroidobacteraceae bacterium]
LVPVNKKRRGVLQPTPLEIAPAGELAGLPARSSPKLEIPSCQNHVGQKGTLCIQCLDFYHLSNISLCDNGS